MLRCGGDPTRAFSFNVITAIIPFVQSCILANILVIKVSNVPRAFKVHNVLALRAHQLVLHVVKTTSSLE